MGTRLSDTLAKPRVVVGINDGHNASAALLVEGRFVAALQEERLTRSKNQGGFPTRAIDALLRQAGLERDHVDVWAVASLYQDRYVPWDPDSVRARYAQRAAPLRPMARRIVPLLAARKWQIAAKRRRLLEQHGLRDRVSIVEHHTAHAAAALWACHDAGPRLVLTADAVGDYLSATVNVAEGRTLRRIAATRAEHSVGQLYSNVTYLLGMAPLEHEHKVMGLAPHGARSRDAVARVRARLDEAVQPSSDGLSWTTRMSMVDGAELVAPLLGRERFDAVAAALQGFLEDHLVRWVRAAIRATGIPRVAVSGGVFMNVKANQRILALPEVEDLVILPSCGDETNSFGAACHVAWSGRSPNDVRPLEHLYLGPTPTTADAQALLAGATDVTWRLSADPARDVAELLARGAIVARCAGPMEFGARALGNRSILADPARPEVVRVLNDAIKARDFWMPFAPAILEERVDEYVVRPRAVASPFMMLTFDTRRERQHEIVAAIHPADLTARVQIVDRTADPAFSAVLRQFEALTGRAAVLNTSFNLHGEPIVCDARDALDVFRRSGLRHLQLADLIVEKRSG